MIVPTMDITADGAEEEAKLEAKKCRLKPEIKTGSSVRNPLHDHSLFLRFCRWLLGNPLSARIAMWTE
jgi:hypothetical protein